MSDDIKRLAERALSAHRRMVFDQYGRPIEDGAKAAQEVASVRRLSTQNVAEAMKAATQVQRVVSEESESRRTP